MRVSLRQLLLGVTSACALAALVHFVHHVDRSPSVNDVLHVVRSRCGNVLDYYDDDGSRSLAVIMSDATDAELARLRWARSIRSLSLMYGRVSDDGLTSVATIPKLRELDISHASITDVGLSALAGHAELERIDLSGTAVTFEGLQCLRSCSHLKRIRIDNCKNVPAAQRDKIAGWIRE